MKTHLIACKRAATIRSMASNLRIEKIVRLARALAVMAGIAAANIAITACDRMAEKSRSPACAVNQASVSDDSFVVDGQLDYGYIISASVDNTGNGGEVEVTAVLSSSEGEWSRRRTAALGSRQSTTLQFQFTEPTINAADIRYRVSCRP